jgi:hypothetical protein
VEGELGAERDYPVEGESRDTGAINGEARLHHITFLPRAAFKERAVAQFESVAVDFVLAQLLTSQCPSTSQHKATVQNV